MTKLEQATETLRKIEKVMEEEEGLVDTGEWEIICHCYAAALNSYHYYQKED